jgi:hypothetical protein
MSSARVRFGGAEGQVYMASQITRNSPVYWNNKKIGRAQKSKYDQNGAVTQEDTADAIVLAIGQIKTSLQLDILSPVGGPGVTVRVQEQGKLAVLCEGQLHTIDAVCTSKSQDSEAGSGKTMATWSFVGGEAQIST